jgi:hypothetical protein
MDLGRWPSANAYAFVHWTCVNGLASAQGGFIECGVYKTFLRRMQMRFRLITTGNICEAACCTNEAVRAEMEFVIWGRKPGWIENVVVLLRDKSLQSGLSTLCIC